MFHVKHDVPGTADLAEWFGDSVPRVHRYVELLTTAGVSRGLIGPREVDRIWSRHILNCAAVQTLVPRDCCVGDIGSGAGLPGIPLALARRDLRVTLIEPLLRRVTFLEEVLQELDLPSLLVVRARAEDLPGQQSFDVVTARAVAPLARLARWGLPLCRPGGVLLAIKGANAQEELLAAAPTLASLGAGRATVEWCGAGVVEPLTTVVRIESGGRTET